MSVVELGQPAQVVSSHPGSGSAALPTAGISNRSHEGPGGCRSSFQPLKHSWTNQLCENSDQLMQSGVLVPVLQSHGPGGRGGGPGTFQKMLRPQFTQNAFGVDLDTGGPDGEPAGGPSGQPAGGPAGLFLKLLLLC